MTDILAMLVIRLEREFDERRLERDRLIIASPFGPMRSIEQQREIDLATWREDSAAFWLRCAERDARNYNLYKMEKDLV